MSVKTRRSAVLFASAAAVISMGFSPHLASAAAPPSVPEQAPPITTTVEPGLPDDGTATDLPTTPAPGSSTPPSDAGTSADPDTSPSSASPDTSTATPSAPGKRLAPAVTAGCQTYPPTTFEVCGRIRDKYNQTGGPTGFLLFPKSNELTNPGNTGKRSEFVGGNIYWSAATDAHPVAHDFLTEWGNNGYESGYMKYPTTDEIVLSKGRRQEFQGGGIYWSPLSGAHTLHGTIRTKWEQLGSEDGYLGYPISNEMPAPEWLTSEGDMVQFFQGGTLIWKASNNTAVAGGWTDYLPSKLPVVEEVQPSTDTQESGENEGSIVPAATTPCPSGTTGHTGDAAIYNCVTQYKDLQGNSNIVRSGRKHNAQGKGGFGQTHYKGDHSVEDHAVELLLQDSPPQHPPSWVTRRLYAKAFQVADHKVISFQVVSNWAPLSGQGTDNGQFGVVTAYCSLPDEQDKELEHCPDLMPPFNVKNGE